MRSGFDPVRISLNVESGEATDIDLRPEHSLNQTCDLINDSLDKEPVVELLPLVRIAKADTSRSETMIDLHAPTIPLYAYRATLLILASRLA